MGKQIKIQLSQDIHCIACYQVIKKSYQRGYCFPCTQTLAKCDICIVKPELCHYDKGTCREPDWGIKNCMQPHIVYLANTSHLKVGITRASNVPRRWMEQDATQALPIIGVKKRLHSGIIERALCTIFKDKTHWQAMLRSTSQPVDLQSAQMQAIQCLMEAKLHAELDYKILSHTKVLEINYPIQAMPKSFKSLSLKESYIEGHLIGLKGQYLLFEEGVININKFKGHTVKINVV